MEKLKNWKMGLWCILPGRTPRPATEPRDGPTQNFHQKCRKIPPPSGTPAKYPPKYHSGRIFRYFQGIRGKFWNFHHLSHCRLWALVLGTIFMLCRAIWLTKLDFIQTWCCRECSPFRNTIFTETSRMSDLLSWRNFSAMASSCPLSPALSSSHCMILSSCSQANTSWCTIGDKKCMHPTFTFWNFRARTGNENTFHSTRKGPSPGLGGSCGGASEQHNKLPKTLRINLRLCNAISCKINLFPIN